MPGSTTAPAFNSSPSRKQPNQTELSPAVPRIPRQVEEFGRGKSYHSVQRGPRYVPGYGFYGQRLC